MAINLDEILSREGGDWRWSIPEHFNIAEACVDRHLQDGHGDRLAFIVEDQEAGTTTLDYQELARYSAAFAGVLKALSIRPGDRVLIRLPNSTDYPISFFGCLKQGAIAVPTSTLLAPDEVAWLARDSGARVLVIHKSMWDELRPALRDCPDLETVLLSGTGGLPEPSGGEPEVRDLTELLAQTEPVSGCIDSRADEPAYLVYTSGTTGYPKGVLHAHRALLGRLPASRHWFDRLDKDRIMHSGKFNWTYVLGSALMDPLLHGQTVIVYEGQNDAHTWPALIKKHACTIFIGVPTLYRQIIQKTDCRARDLPSLRHCMSAGEHLSDEMQHAWQERFGRPIYEAIGMSEISYYISQRIDREVVPGAAGFPQPGHQVRLLDTDGEEVGTDEEGMIAIAETDPGLFLGYWQLPEETAKVKRDGWFLTGDFARRDARGYIWFLGRRDDIINTFGYRVSPHEVERVFKSYPGVADCVAMGEVVAQDKTLVSLCVIPEAGTELNEQNLLDFGRDRLAAYKAPKKVHFMEAFPRTKNGKVLRKTLQQTLEKTAGDART